MKKKLILLAASLFAVAAIGTTLVATNSNNETSLLALRNAEALAQEEDGTSVGSCPRISGPTGELSERMFCDSSTDSDTIYPCPTETTTDYYLEDNDDRCTN
jgi:hypothetical protein